MPTNPQLDIRPCPFCGDSDPAIDEVEVKVWAIVCNGCGCIGPIENYDNASQTAEVAIELWNRRVEPSAVPATPEWAKEYAKQ